MASYRTYRRLDLDDALARAQRVGRKRRWEVRREPAALWADSTRADAQAPGRLSAVGLFNAGQRISDVLGAQEPDDSSVATRADLPAS